MGVSSLETTSTWPARATPAAARAANFLSAAPALTSQAVPTAASARRSAGSTPPYKPLDALRLEIEAAKRDRLDGEALVLEPAQDLLPGLTGARRVLLDERERRAHAERLREQHPGPDASRLRCGGDDADLGPPPRYRRERGRLEKQGRPRPEGRPQLEARNEDASDHGNVCSIRTYVPCQAHLALLDSDE